MTTIVLVLAALLVAASLLLTVMAIRRRPRTAALVREPGSATAASSLDRLEVGAEVLYDDREWVVIGAQRFAAHDGFPAWTAWHLDLKGQPGWMATVDGDPDELTFAVGAEKPETIDPAQDPVVWRDVPWTRIAEAADGPLPVAAEGQRRRNRQPREDLTTDDVERVTFTRDDLPRRRLILERRVADERWAAWIGDRVPVAMVDVTRWPAQPS
ncbi:MAG: hypothetical protein ITG02_02005 [Patulibacter sp.]|nr:hypothetical protein [Patulibacter sp.]